jgi:hypothetical protein
MLRKPGFPLIPQARRALNSQGSFPSFINQSMNFARQSRDRHLVDADDHFAQENPPNGPVTVD